MLRMKSKASLDLKPHSSYLKKACNFKILSSLSNSDKELKFMLQLHDRSRNKLSTLQKCVDRANQCTTTVKTRV